MLKLSIFVDHDQYYDVALLSRPTNEKTKSPFDYLELTKPMYIVSCLTRRHLCWGIRVFITLSYTLSFRVYCCLGGCCSYGCCISICFLPICSSSFHLSDTSPPPPSLPLPPFLVLFLFLILILTLLLLLFPLLNLRQYQIPFIYGSFSISL